MRTITCAFTGHRPGRLTMTDGISSRLEQAIREAIADGYTTFLSGGAMGADLWCAQMVLALKAQFPHIRLCFILPCANHTEHWPDAWRAVYAQLQTQADMVIVLSDRYSIDCMRRRNHALVYSADRLIALYDGIEAGGTAYTIRCARQQNRDICIIAP